VTGIVESRKLDSRSPLPGIGGSPLPRLPIPGSHPGVTRTALVFDLGLALLLVAIGIWVTTAGLLPRVTWVSLGFMIPALIVRRVLPATALGLAWISTIAQLGSGLDVSFLQVGTVIVLYSAVAYGRRWVMVLAGASVTAGVVVSVITLVGAHSWTWVFVPPSNRPIFTPIIVLTAIPLAVLGGAWLAGLASRLLRRSQQSAISRRLAEDEALRSEAIAALEREKAELARDVHDVVGHSLAVIIAQSDSVRFLDASDADAVRRTVATIAETARRSLGEVRQVLTQIEAVETGAIGVAPALDQVLANVRASGASLEATQAGTPVLLSSRAADAAHRVLQETLTNALKFADRDRPIAVHQQWSVAGLELGVRNHVVPGDTVDPDRTGSGIDGMRSRLDALGGRLDVQVIPDARGAGSVFDVRAVIPAGVRS